MPSVGRVTFRPPARDLEYTILGAQHLFEIRQLDLSLAHLGHLPGARHPLV